MIIHICSAAITDRFYSIFFKKLFSKNQKLLSYIPYDGSKYLSEDVDQISEMLSPYSNTIFLPIKKPIDRILYFKKINKYFHGLDNAFNLNKANIVHAHSLFTDGGVARKIRHKYGIPYVVAVRSTDIYVFLRYFRHLHHFARKLLDDASAIVYISPQLRFSTEKILYKNGVPDRIRDKSYVIPNGINEYWLKNKYEERKQTGDTIGLIQVSRLNPGKNVDKSIRAVKMLLDNGVKCKLDIYGEGPDKSKLKMLIDELQLNDHVTLKGFTSDKNTLLEAYRNKDIFIMPAECETFGISYVEAMTQGLPIIGLKGTGVDGFFKSKVGEFVDKPDPKLIAEAVVRILENINQYSINCLKESEQCNWDLIVPLYLSIYEKMKDVG